MTVKKDKELDLVQRKTKTYEIEMFKYLDLNPDLKMYKNMNELNFNVPSVPIISNFNAKPENKVSNLKKNLIDQVTGTVRWRETMNLANELGVKRALELGNGKVLTGIAKRMLNNVYATNIEKPSDFDEVLKLI